MKSAYVEDIRNSWPSIALVAMFYTACVIGTAKPEWLFPSLFGGLAVIFITGEVYARVKRWRSAK